MPIFFLITIVDGQHETVLAVVGFGNGHRGVMGESPDELVSSE